MAGGKGKLRPEDNPKPWKKGQSGNPKGPKVKVFSEIARGYQERGIEKATPEVVKEAFEYMLALPVSEILEMSSEKKAIEDDMPSLLSLVAKDMTGKNGLAAIKEMLNRAHGTPAPKDDSVTHLHITFDDDMELPKMSLKKETNTKTDQDE